MKKGDRLLGTALVLAIGIVVGIVVATQTSAALNPFDISYPIEELGNCASQQDCKQYCDVPEHQLACIDFAEAHGMMTPDAAAHARAVISGAGASAAQVPGDAPGGCKTPRECDEYCTNPDHELECLDFSVRHGYITEEDAAKVRARLEMRKRGGPGGCKSEEECDAYCSNPAHGRECILFAVKEGQLTEEEANFLLQSMEEPHTFREEGPHPGGPPEEFDKTKAAKIISTQGGPGGCRTMEECAAYCDEESHMEECLAFAKEHQLAPPEKLEKVEKLAAEGGPGGCQGPKECDAYCSKEEHMEECFEFAKKHGLLDPEEAMRTEKQIEILKKLHSGAAGPGGCQGPKECDAYCSKEEHMEECMEFAVKHGIMDPGQVEQLKMMRQAPRGNPGPSFEGGPFPGNIPPPGPPFGVPPAGERFEMRKGESRGMPFGPMEPHPFPTEKFPPEVVQCLKNALGRKFIELERGMAPPSPEVEQVIRKCMGEAVPPPPGEKPFPGFPPKDFAPEVQQEGLPGGEAPLPSSFQNGKFIPQGREDGFFHGGEEVGGQKLPPRPYFESESKGYPPKEEGDFFSPEEGYMPPPGEMPPQPPPPQVPGIPEIPGNPGMPPSGQLPPYKVLKDVPGGMPAPSRYQYQLPPTPQAPKLDVVPVPGEKFAPGEIPSLKIQGGEPLPPPDDGGKFLPPDVLPPPSAVPPPPPGQSSGEAPPPPPEEKNTGSIGTHPSLLQFLGIVFAPFVRLLQ